MAQKLGTEVRTQQIIQAALSLVASHGLKGLSIARIAHRVGLVPSAIYRHFRNKDQVIEAILDHIRENLLANVKRIIEKTSEPLERLRRLLELHMQLISENHGILRLVFSEDVMSGPPTRKTRIQAIIETYLRAVAEIVRQGQKEGVIRAGLEADSVAVAFLGMIQPAAILWHLSEGEYNLPNHIDRAWNIFLGGILSPTYANPGKTGESTVAYECYQRRTAMKKINLFEANDFGDKGLKKLLVHDSPYFKIINFNFKAGQELPVHSHDIDGQLSLVILEGNGEFLGKDGTSFPGQQGDVVISDIAAPHGFRATTNVRLLVTIAPPI